MNLPQECENNPGVPDTVVCSSVLETIRRAARAKPEPDTSSAPQSVPARRGEGTAGPRKGASGNKNNQMLQPYVIYPKISA